VKGTERTKVKVKRTNYENGVKGGKRERMWNDIGAVKRLRVLGEMRVMGKPISIHPVVSFLFHISKILHLKYSGK